MRLRGSIPVTRESDADDVPRLDGINVLVVDDEPDALEVAATALRVFGATVTTAFSSAEGLELIDRARFDAVVCDLAMPGETGVAHVALVGKGRRLRG
jgi:CheY-like chemotaxis protein